MSRCTTCATWLSLAGLSLTRSGIAPRPTSIKFPPPLHLHLPYLSLPLIIIFLSFYSCCTPGPLRHGMLRPLLLYLNLLIISSTDAPLLITLKISNYYFTPIAYNILTHLPWTALTSINIYCAMLPLC